MSEQLLHKLSEIKRRIGEIEKDINSGHFIAECLQGLDEEYIRKCITRYVDALNSLAFERDQLSDDIEAAKPDVKQYLMREGLTKARMDHVSADMRKRTTYKGLDAEVALRDKGMLDEAISSGALSYPPTVNAKKLTPEIKEAIECAAKVTHSITIK